MDVWVLQQANSGVRAAAQTAPSGWTSPATHPQGVVLGWVRVAAAHALGQLLPCLQSHSGGQEHTSWGMRSGAAQANNLQVSAAAGLLAAARA